MQSGCAPLPQVAKIIQLGLSPQLLTLADSSCVLLVLDCGIETKLKSDLYLANLLNKQQGLEKIRSKKKDSKK